MAADFHFDHQFAFAPDRAAEILRQIPAQPGVFALHGPRVEGQMRAEPYLTRAADLRRRITRILAPPQQLSPDGTPAQSKRLNLGSRVASVEYTVTGSEFESTLTLYHAASSIFGLDQARRRLKLRTPYFLRFTTENAYPRVYSTNRLSKRSLENFYGPFPSRAAADRYCDAVLDLFKLRRCYEDLIPTPDHPGCVYQEMKKCLAPCNQAHTPEGAAAYSAEAAAVKRFFDTRGESMIIDIGLEREEASAAMEFEKAAALHTQWQKVKSAQSLADELVQPIPKLQAIIVQKSAAAASYAEARSGGQESASTETAAEAEPTAAIFLLHSGCIAGPERLSTLGVRAVKEQTSVGSSLFAQPLMLQAIPLAPSQLPGSDPSPPPSADPPWLSAGGPSLSSDKEASLSSDSEPSLAFRSEAEGSASSPVTATLNPELRAEAVITALQERTSAPTDTATLSDHLSLLRRWYYRPEKQRAGEIFFPRAAAASPPQDSPAAASRVAWPIRRILRGAARMALGEPKPLAETQRDLAQRNPEDEAQKSTRTRILHEGRPDVQREVPIIEKKFRSRKPATPPPTET